MRPTSILSSLLILAASSTAWPWPESWGMPAQRRAVEAPAAVEKRQQGGSTTSKFNLSFSAPQGNTATTKSPAKNTKTNNNKNPSPSSASSITASASYSKQTGKQTGKHTGKTTDNTKKTTKYETTKTFDNRLPAGGVSMITPNAFAGPKYYKIGDYITYAWNYTSLSITPSAIDILASCSLNSATYTLALNQTVDPTQSFTWDTGAYQATATQPLLMATYTLIIYDAAEAVTAAPRAGYLGMWDGFSFGMYVPQAYTPIADYVCATCNGAMSSTAKMTVWGVLGVAGVTVVSFGWFAGVAGLW